MGSSAIGSLPVRRVLGGVARPHVGAGDCGGRVGLENAGPVVVAKKVKWLRVTRVGRLVGSSFSSTSEVEVRGGGHLTAPSRVWREPAKCRSGVQGRPFADALNAISSRETLPSTADLRTARPREPTTMRPVPSSPEMSARALPGVPNVTRCSAGEEIRASVASLARRSAPCSSAMRRSSSAAPGAAETPGMHGFAATCASTNRVPRRDARASAIRSARRAPALLSSPHAIVLHGSSAGASAGTASTGHSAPASTADDTLPRRAARSGPRPRVPTTMSAASSLSAARRTTVAGLPGSQRRRTSSSRADSAIS